MHNLENYDIGHFGNTDTYEFKQRVMNYRVLQKEILSSRITEMLPHLIAYEGLPNTISSIHLESLLRLGTRPLIIGEDIKGDLCILGYATSISFNYYNYPVVNGISWILPKEQLLPKSSYKQITPQDLNGNYVLVRNRFNHMFIPDQTIIDHYTTHLAEIKTSRYSLSIQSKCITYFKGVDAENNNSLNKTINDFMNGSPVLKVENALEVNNMIGSIDNAGVIASLLQTNKEEYMNIFNEMLNLLGIINTGNDKTSGVNPIESKANKGLLETVSLIYINTRQDAFDLINTRYGTMINVQHGIDLTEFINAEQNMGEV